MLIYTSIYLIMYVAFYQSMYVLVYLFYLCIYSLSLPYTNIMLMPPTFIHLHLFDKERYSDPQRLPIAIDPNASRTAYVCNLLMGKEQ